MLKSQQQPNEQAPSGAKALMLCVTLLVSTAFVGLITCSTLLTTKPAANSPSKSAVAPDAGPVPTSLADVGEYGENLYDLAKANNWAKAGATLASLKKAAKRLRADLKNSGGDADQLDARIAALEKAVAAKDRPAAMREANQVTWLAANLSMPFSPPVPVDVTRLDYYGRELEIWVAAKDTARLKTTADEMRRTWAVLRPSVEAHGGKAEAKKFNDLIARVEAAASPEEYGRLAKPILDEVDNLEKVFKKK